MRRILSLLLLLTALAAYPCRSGAAALGKEFSILEELYKSGDLDTLADQLFKTKPQNDEERALQTYLEAMLKDKSSESVPLLEQAAERYPNALYGQLALLERAKVFVLERKTAEAKALLQKINSPAVLERFYWLAVCADVLDDSAAALSHAENYLRLAPQGKFLEEANYLIARAYQQQGKYQSAISTLNKLAALEGYPRNEQYFRYLSGNLQTLAGHPADALEQYRLGFELNRNSQLGLEIEDQLHELKGKYPSSVDLGFLYPYGALDIPVPSDTLRPDTTQVVDTGPIKLGAKPAGGYFVQAGRFGVEANANQLAFDIRRLKYTANYYEDKANKNTPWVVVSGPYPSKAEADGVRQTLVGKGIDCFITRF